MAATSNQWRTVAIAIALTAGIGACGGNSENGARTIPTESTTSASSPSEAAPTDPASTGAASTTGAAGTTTAAAPGSRSAASASAATTTQAPPSTQGTPSGSPPRLKLTKVADLDGGTAMAVRAGDPAFYVTQQDGRVRAIRNGALDPTPVLDLTAETARSGEMGLLGLTFQPDGARLYVYFTQKAGGDVQLSSFAMRADGTADPSQRIDIFTIEHSEFGNHNGGNIVFGPDGFLYAGVGDGGSGGDPHGNAQNTGVLLGKLLRIDPLHPTGAKHYGIPATNPFASGGGAPEVWAYGLRNPWRYSWDTATGDLWIADVGQDDWEEANVVAGNRPAVNYGWGKREGKHAFNGGDRPAGAVDPVVETSHRDGDCSITGGFVYRGSAIPGLVGRYIFTDYCQSTIRAARPTGGGAYTVDKTNISGSNVASFGQAADGTIYVLDANGFSRIDAG